MIPPSIDFVDDDQSPIDYVQLDLQQVKTNLPLYSSEKLCEMIVCDRYFGFGHQIAVMCMEELAARRIKGDIFDFETYIDQEYKKLPKLNFSVPDIRATLQNAINMRNRK